MFNYDYTADMAEQNALDKKHNKKKLNELLDKYGESKEAIEQNADVKDSFEYMFAHGDNLIEEVLEERRMKRSLSSFSQSPYPVTTKNNQNYVASNNLSEIEDKDTFIRNKNNADYKLGTLSSKHESLRNPAAIGHDNAGGYSYGSYQIATKTGTMKSYIDYLKQNTKYLNYYNMLINAGGNDAALIKTEEFEQTWKYLSKNADFNQSQKQFLIETHLNRLLNSVKEKNLLNLKNRHPVIKDVLYSMSVQHYRAPNIVNNTLATLKEKYGNNADKITDKTLIEELYRKRAQYVKSLPESQFLGDHKITKSEKNNILKNRYPEELRDALRYLN